MEADDARIETPGRRRSCIRKEPEVVIVENNYRIPKFKNSSKFAKEVRPPHLQDDNIFDSLALSDVTNQMAMWTQTKAVMETNALRVKKAEKTSL